MTAKPWTLSIKEIRKEYNIPKNGELRIEVEFSEKAAIKLLAGTAELYGTELCTGKEYEFCGEKLAIFTFEEAKVVVRGKCEVEYVSQETVQHAYMNTHLALEGMRQEAASRGEDAPRVVVLGQSRSTVTRSLLNYAARAGHTPVYVDLDVANGTLVMPGVMGAQMLDKPMDVEEGLGSDGNAQPCLYYYGATTPTENARLYRKLMARLAMSVNSRLAAMSDDSKSGAIICCPADGQDLIEEIQQLFKASLILVVGNERLYSTVSKSMANSNSKCTVLRLPKSGGVVTKDRAYRRDRMQAAYQKYFYGAKGEYSPFSINLDFDKVQIRRLGEDALAPKSALPLGATRKVDESKAVKIEPTSGNILYSILAVSWATTEEQLIDTNVAGFIYVTGVDEGKKQITALSTCSGKLPTAYLIIGSLKWLEK